ncbi:low temperature requirement protein A [Micromonospora chaiyaphumensis]|uniref:Low temperature requirement protein LtrA n=1 Tax=Micromonospora chaiyaphumensis TaxID=307119 RepID=A0A1C4TX97_9ACTN|nr:low temperature requirement protein A [Micromonospora chaiyaphumensis]SCE64061.1 Low temperature requirement protein LtrA [Micromonospora chaiyaphumensis]
MAGSRSDLLELFFDLSLIATLTLTSEKMAGEGWTGLAQALLTLSTLWAVWVTTTSFTDLYSPQERPIQLVVLGIMFGGMLMSAALPTAFDGHGLIFGATWAGINWSRGLVIIVALRSRPERERPIRVLLWTIVSGSLWLAGGLVADPGGRLGVWLVALAVDYVAFGFRFPIPGRPPLPRYRVVPEHLAERYQQIYVLTLGELILVTVLTLSHMPFSMDRVGAFATAFVATVLLWWSYARGAGARLRGAIERAPHRYRLVQTNPYAHWLMVVGVVGLAAGFSRVIAQPGARPEANQAALVLGGVVLFLVGRATLDHEVLGRVPLSHVVGVLAAVALVPAAPRLGNLMLSLVATLVLFGVAAAEFARRQREGVAATP